MRTITHFNQQRPTDVRVEPNGPGTWLVYEPGDTLPVEPPSPPAASVLTVQEFRDRFTLPELAAIATSTDAGVRVLVLKVTTRTDVPLDNADVIAGLDLLVARGLLTPARKAAILA